MRPASDELCRELSNPENAAVKLAFDSLDDDIKDSCKGLAWCEVPYQDLQQVQANRLMRNLIVELRRARDEQLEQGGE